MEYYCTPGSQFFRNFFSHYSAWGISSGAWEGSKNREKNLFNIFFFTCFSNGKWIHPRRLTFQKIPHFGPPYDHISPKYSCRSWDIQSLDSRLQKTHINASTDSLLAGMSTGSIHDADSYFQAECNQVFIGMISLQYQAKQVHIVTCQGGRSQAKTTSTDTRTTLL